MSSTTTAIHGQSRPKLAFKALLRFDRHEQRFLLLSPERGLLLNETAAEIVHLCTGRITIETMAKMLSSLYTDRTPDVIVSDVVAFLSHLQSRGLIEV
jgi:coenzyme PQQ biosynthesis protein PqqD